MKILSLYRQFLNFLASDVIIGQKYAQVGDLLLTFRLLNTPALTSESKLVYAYLFSHKHDGTGCRIPVLCECLSMTQGQVYAALKELEAKMHIKLITALRNDDMVIFAYYYEIVEPNKYGMYDLEKELCPIFMH